MSRWIYIKSNDESDAYATSAVLLNSPDKFNIVRRSKYTQYFINNPNVEQIDFADEVKDLIVINETGESSFIGRCQAINSLLNFEALDSYTPFIDRTKHLDEIYSNQKIILYVLSPILDNLLDLAPLDKLAERNLMCGYVTIDSGSMQIPPIHNCIDGRNVVRFDTIGSIIDDIKLIVTNENIWLTISESLDIPAIFWNEKVDNASFLNIEKQNKLFFECSNIIKN